MARRFFADGESAPKASVFIPVLNGARHLPALIAAVRQQKLAESEIELFAIDSGSTDGSLTVLHNLGVRTLEIPNAQFGHGRTRNEAMRLTTGEFVAFLTQDAVPTRGTWLARLLEPFSDERVAATFGRQTPRPDADPRTARIIEQVYDDQPRRLAASPGGPIFSSVNSCVRRTAWEAVPFRDVPYAEDYYLAQDLLARGLEIAYCPDAEVLHSNSYTLRQHFGRMVDEVGALPAPASPHPLRSVLVILLRESAANARYARARRGRWSARDLSWAVASEIQRRVPEVVRSRWPERYGWLTRFSLEGRLRRRGGTAP